MNLTLTDACEEIVDCINRTAPEDEGGDYYVVGTPAMRGNRIDYSEARRVNKETFDAWNRRLIPKEGDLLVAREAPVGPVVRIPSGGHVGAGQRTTLLRPNPAVVDGGFLYYYLISPAVQARFISLGYGSTTPHVRVEDVRSFALNEVPSLPEQWAIAEVLGALDDKIAANDRIRTLTAQLSAALYRESVVASCHSLTVAQGAVLLSRGASPKYSDEESATIVLNQKCVRDGDIDLAPARRTEPTSVRVGTLLQRDDVLVNSTGMGTLGRVARWIRPEQATVDSHVTIVRPDPQTVDPVVFGIALMQLQAEIEGLAEGSTGQTELSRQQLGSLLITMPERPKQAALGTEIRALSQRSLVATRESQALAALRDALLPELMSGRKRVKDVESTVEGVL